MTGVSLRTFLVYATIPVLCLGCGKADGPELATVSGTVTLDGKPLPHVNIRFIPEKEGGSPAYGGTNADGKYKLMFSQDRAGAMLGMHRVEIEPREPEIGENSDPKAAAAQAVTIPAKYLERGALTADVKQGANTFDFALDSK
ncbi:MAG: hypothetical protein SH850_15280 [Planctomycetaceae bacterium]|nr:hypothetical protein [Planctomycetaceae bacterium]